MAEKFRIDLGNDQLFGSQSIDPNSTGIHNTVVYDTAKQTFYYTGSYGGGGSGTTTGSFTGSFTGSISGTISEAEKVRVQSAAGDTYLSVTLNDNAGFSSLKQDPNDIKYSPGLDTLIVDGTISASNFINVGTVAGSKITGSFTGSFDGSVTTASHAETIKVTNSSFDTVRKIPFLNSTIVLSDATATDLGYNPSSHTFFTSNISASRQILVKDSASANVTGSVTITSESIVGTVTGADGDRPPDDKAFELLADGDNGFLKLYYNDQNLIELNPQTDTKILPLNGLYLNSGFIFINASSSPYTVDSGFDTNILGGLLVTSSLDRDWET